MSEKTYHLLEDALRAHLADENEGEPDVILTDWYVIAAAEVAAAERGTTYFHIASETPLHSLYGLVAHAHRRLLQDDSDD